MRYFQKQITSLFFFCILFIVSCTRDSKETENINEPSTNLDEYTIHQLQQAYKEESLSIEEVIIYYQKRIKEIDQNGPALNSVIALNTDAVSIAKLLDQELKQLGPRGPMHGIPVLLKDNIDTHDKMPTTAGSLALAKSFPLQDSYIVKKLRESGAVILGKTNLSEWANFRGSLSSSGWSAVGGQCKNPYDTTRNPCGSSAGSGVAVSANLTMIAIGTETNGSIVCPSTSNGIVGIKPTVGLLSRSGIIPISFTQDTAGPMARTLTDAAICLGAMVGIDSTDSKSIASREKAFSDYTQFLKKDGLQGKRIAYLKDSQGVHFKVDQQMDSAIAFMKSQGAEIIEIDNIAKRGSEDLSFEIMLYEYKDGLNKYFASLGTNSTIKTLEDLIAFNKEDTLEMSFYDQKYLEMANKMAGLESKEYNETLAKVLKAYREDGIDRVMDEHRLDAIVGPTGSPAWKTDHTNGDAYVVSSSSPAAISGYPNITVPMGFIEGLPVGISFFGRAWSEPILLELAYSFEQGTMARKAPKL